MLQIFHVALLSLSLSLSLQMVAVGVCVFFQFASRSAELLLFIGLAAFLHTLFVCLVSFPSAFDRQNGGMAAIFAPRDIIGDAIPGQSPLTHTHTLRTARTIPFATFTSDTSQKGEIRLVGPQVLAFVCPPSNCFLEC